MKYYQTDFNIRAAADILGDARDLVAALAGEAGYETFEETPTGLKGYVQKQLYDEDALRQALADFPFEGVKITYATAEAEDRDWNEAWEQEGFEPIIVGGRLAIHDGRHLPTEEVEMEVEIDAKLAFGTGNHETTQMVAGELLDLDLRGKTLLDAGCGTGILSLVALKAGAAHATGYDIDEWSVDNARHNAVINRLGDRFTALLGDSAAIEKLDGKVDVVVANIFRDILVADLPRFAKALRPGGRVILSGFYEADAEAVIAAAERCGLSVEKVNTLNGWACLVLSPR